MNKMEKISVVMSTQNAEDYVAESIESVLKQSHSNFEFIIVDNGSTDKTRSIIASFGDRRIRIVDSDLSHSQSLNIGLMASTGKYVALTNTDSIMHVDRLKLQHSMMEEFSIITVCGCWEIVFGEKMPKRTVEQKFSGLVESPLIQLLLEDVMIDPMYTIRKSFIDDHKVRYEDYAFSEDYKLWSEIAKREGCFYIDPQPLVYNRINYMHVSRYRREEKLKNVAKIKKEIVHTLCSKYSDSHPALLSLFHAFNELSSQNFICDNDIFGLFYSLFIRNGNSPKNMEGNLK